MHWLMWANASFVLMCVHACFFRSTSSWFPSGFLTRGDAVTAAAGGGTESAEPKGSSTSSLMSSSTTRLGLEAEGEGVAQEHVDGSKPIVVSPMPPRAVKHSRGSRTFSSMTEGMMRVAKTIGSFGARPTMFASYTSSATTTSTSTATLSTSSSISTDDVPASAPATLGAGRSSQQASLDQSTSFQDDLDDSEEYGDSVSVAMDELKRRKGSASKGSTTVNDASQQDTCSVTSDMGMYNVAFSFEVLR
eukprot:m.114722 g.114722  ORF g.114722 m.114722 type:complete len:248 (+) comp13549_c0_seq3:2185-2928(+)